MSKEAFTPGPWIVGPYGCIWPASDVAIADGKWTETCDNPRLIDSDLRLKATAEEKANVHLMATAPEMYEALKPLEDSATHFAADAPEWDDNATIQVVLSIGDLRRAAAALSKARGEVQ